MSLIVKSTVKVLPVLDFTINSVPPFTFPSYLMARNVLFPVAKEDVKVGFVLVYVFPFLSFPESIELFLQVLEMM